MKKTPFLLLFITAVAFAQIGKSTKLGLVQRSELEMTMYQKDTTAKAVVLYEHANLYLDERNDLKFRTDFYYRIKLFKKEAFNKATIAIRIYKKESVKDIKAITYHLSEDGTVQKTYLLKKDIFTKQLDDKWKEVTFTLPNIKEGTIIEYVYSTLSPYSQLDDWYFQSDIPKIKSEYDSAILGNWKYNTRIVGFLKLEKDSPSIKKTCVYVPGIGNGSCLILSYGMSNIPAFKEENYMLSEQNFISRLAFDLISYTDVRGGVKNYTKTWKHAEKSFKKDYLDGQTSKKRFFKKNLPPHIISETDELTKAKKIYRYIKDRFTWNENYWSTQKLKIKNIFEKKSGSVDAINLSLYNSLQATGIESYLVMLSTRSNGLPTKLFPVTSDFNYLIVKTIINGTSYFLDATDKNLPFDMLPLRCLNGEGRVLDFKKGGYWEKIPSNKTSTVTTRLQLEFVNDTFKGKIVRIRTGFYALNKREELITISEDEYLDDFESQYSNYEIATYNNKNLTNLEKPLKEFFELTIDYGVESTKTVRINPFFMSRFLINPFKLNKRDYPVDYGYKRSKTFMLNLKIPKNYTIKKMPDDIFLKLPNKGGSFIFKTIQKDHLINVYYKFKIAKKIFSKEEYFYLKEFYKQIIKSQESYIELEKKE